MMRLAGCRSSRVLVLIPVLVLIAACADESTEPEIEIELVTISGIVSHGHDGPIEGATVIVDQLEARTNRAGEYALTEVPPLAQPIRCTHPDYNDFTGQLEVNDRQVDIIMTRTVRDTAYVLEDATVRDDIRQPEQGATNYGSDPTLVVRWRSETEWRNSLRTFIKLPRLVARRPDFARLQLNLVRFEGPDGLVLCFRAVTSDWQEMAITFDDQPSVAGDRLIEVNPSDRLQPLDPLIIDVLSLYEGEAGAIQGLRIADRQEELGESVESPRGVTFHAREATDRLERPFVDYQYTF